MQLGIYDGLVNWKVIGSSPRSMTSLAQGRWQGMVSLLLSGSYFQQGNCWLLPSVCVPLLHPQGYDAMVVVIVVQASQLDRPIGYFSHLEGVWYLLVPEKLVIREEALKEDAAQVLWVLCLKCMVSSNRDLASTSGRQPRAISMFLESLG